MANIKTILIFEMLGRPAEHLKETLAKFIDKLSKERGVKLIHKKINEPKRIEEAKQEIYSNFAEVDIDFESISDLLRAVFIYMPSHIEITYPKEISFKGFELNELVNELARKLHQYDELAKRLLIENQILERKIQEAVGSKTEEGNKQEAKKQPKRRKSKKK